MASVSPAGSMSLGNALVALGFVPPHPLAVPIKKITRAYKRAALACHPDKNPDDTNAVTLFLKVKAAYDELLGAVGKPAEQRGARPSTAGYQAWQEQARSNPATMNAAFASFRPKTEQTDASKDPAKRPRDSAAKPPADPTGSASRSKPKRVEVARRQGGGSSGCGGARRTAPRTRPWGVSPAWGAACGTCADCRAEAAVPRSIKKKRDKLKMFADVAIEQRPAKPNRARHCPYTTR